MATEEKDEHEEKDNAAADEAKAEAEEEAEARPAKKSAAAKPKPARSAGARGRAPAARQGSSLGKSMILFVVIIGGLAAGFAILGRDQQPGAPPKPKWQVGQTVDVEITLVKNDKNDLSCASPDEVAGKHCAFEAVNKAWSKGPSTDDKTLLKPYTTTDRMQFAAAGLWSDPILAGDKVPPSRFSVKCKLKVEGQLKNLSVRWDPTGPWHPNTDWFAGAVSDCKLAQ